MGLAVRAPCLFQRCEIVSKMRFVQGSPMGPFDWRICRLVAMRLLTRHVVPWYDRRDIGRKAANDN